MVIVVGSHVYLLIAGLPASQMTAHAILNLVGAAFIGFAWFKKG
jgi:hypothetical protein